MPIGSKMVHFAKVKVVIGEPIPRRAPRGASAPPGGGRDDRAAEDRDSGLYDSVR
ncbi:MAG: hypothetical protein R2789_07440 [Microthrixaceae bacterium]